MDQMKALMANEPGRSAPREYRVAAETWPLEDLELRAEGDGLHFTGYAAVFDSPSEPMPYRETILPGAFATSLRQRRDIKMFLNHNWDIVLASRKGGTLHLAEDGKGLLVEADLPDNEWGRPVRDAVRRGDINSMSFGFQVVRDAWPKPEAERQLVEVKLFEVSPVTAFPAYPATSASVRHLAEVVETDDATMADALRVLVAPEAGDLTDEQAELLRRAIRARHPSRYVSAEIAERLARLEKLRAA